MNHQTARQQLWCNTVIAVASDPLVEDTSTPVDWADHILQAFDERFPEPPAAAEPPAPEIPAGLPPLPPVPEGYDRWVYRGPNWGNKGVGVLYGYFDFGRVWSIRKGFPKGASGHYIEAVKGGDQ
jgi:hypothetical protein